MMAGLRGIVLQELYCKRLGGLDCIAGHKGVLQYRAAVRLKKLYCNCIAREGCSWLGIVLQ